MTKLTATWMGTFEELRRYENIHPTTLQQIIDYVVDGRRPGGFLREVLCDSLQGAFKHGDLQNLATLWAITTFVYNRCPADCHGSPEKYESWNGLRRTMLQVMSKADVDKVVAEWVEQARA